VMGGGSRGRYAGTLFGWFRSGGSGGWWMFLIPNSGVFDSQTASGMRKVLKKAWIEDVSHPRYATDYSSYRS
jgi:hypothetical protein